MLTKINSRKNENQKVKNKFIKILFLKEAKILKENKNITKKYWQNRRNIRIRRKIKRRASLVEKYWLNFRYWKNKLNINRRRIERRTIGN